MIAADWTVVVPVKEFTAAKSRFSLDETARRGLALALAADTLRAVAAAGVRVIVVTTAATFDEVRSAVPGLADQALLVPDPGAGLNAAFTAGLAAAGPAAAALVCDLPALTPHDLVEALEQVTPGSVCHVPDHVGIGTTMLAGNGVRPIPAFGPDSAAMHDRAGSHRIAAGARLRQDIDTTADLSAAAFLGVGPSTRRWLPVALAGARRPTSMLSQATLRTTGVPATAFRDDGTVIELAADPSWRPGQRLTQVGTIWRLAGDDSGPVPGTGAGPEQQVD